MSVSTTTLMQKVMLALLPGAAVMIYWFGVGIAINIVAAVAAAIAAETLVLHIRGQSPRTLFDGSAVVTAILLALCLPPLLPVWLVVLGSAFALLLGKHVYGGLGNNPFNPAMVGYAVLIVSFPLAMSRWPELDGALPVTDVLAIKFGIQPFDGITQATPLDAFKFRGSATIEEFRAGSKAVGTLAGRGWEWINLAFLAGGAWLVYQRITHWLMPAVFLGVLGLLSVLFYDSGSSASLGSPVHHWLGGATMLAAFFILTDPVTSPDGLIGQVVFSAGIAVITFIVRSIGAYPEGIAFAVLLMNAATPLIDQLRGRLKWAGS